MKKQTPTKSRSDFLSSVFGTYLLISCSNLITNISREKWPRCAFISFVADVSDGLVVFLNDFYTGFYNLLFPPFEIQPIQKQIHTKFWTKVYSTSTNLIFTLFNKNGKSPWINKNGFNIFILSKCKTANWSLEMFSRFVFYSFSSNLRPYQINF